MKSNQKFLLSIVGIMFAAFVGTKIIMSDDAEPLINSAKPISNGKIYLDPNTVETLFFKNRIEIVNRSLKHCIDVTPTHKKYTYSNLPDRDGYQFFAKDGSFIFNMTWSTNALVTYLTTRKGQSEHATVRLVPLSEC